MVAMLWSKLVFFSRLSPKSTKIYDILTVVLGVAFSAAMTPLVYLNSTAVQTNPNIPQAFAEMLRLDTITRTAIFYSNTIVVVLLILISIAFFVKMFWTYKAAAQQDSASFAKLRTLVKWVAA